MGLPKITFVIPAFNEARTIQQVVRDVSTFGTVIVVNDCSQDNTKYEAVLGGAKVISNEKNLGYEESIQIGFFKALEVGSDAVVTMDADGQHRIDDVHKVIKEYLDNRTIDLVVGQRSQVARFSEWLFKAYFSIRFSVKDPLCGLKLYVIKNKNDFYFFDRYKLVGSELLLKLLKQKKKLNQVPIFCPPRVDESRYGNVVKANWKILKALLRIIYLDFMPRRHF